MRRRFCRRLFSLLLGGLLGAGLGAQPSTLSLAGVWRVRLDPANDGLAKNWAQGPLPPAAPGMGGVIPLPGSTDQAHLGFANPQPPSFDGLYRPFIYAGAAWYQREITVPPDWRGRVVTLLLERTHGETRVWVDGRETGKPENSLIAPHVYDLGAALAPGPHRLTIREDNTLRLDLGRFASIDYEGTQTNWNGLIGRIELRAADPVALGDAQVYPDPAARRVRVSVRITRASTGGGARGNLELSVVDLRDGQVAGRAQAAFTAVNAVTDVTAEVPLTGKLHRWDEFSPELYELRIGLSAADGAVACVDRRRVTFGLRTLGIDGKHFTLNGRPVFLRGTVDCAVFPLTAYPAMDAAAWRRIFRVLRSYGLNHVRFHSWCPPEAAFAAADAAGFMLQVEAPQANVPQGKDPARDAFIAAEVRRILRTYGNHPSFCLLTMGNELSGDTRTLEQLVDECRRSDPRHLYSGSTYGFGIDPRNRQFTVLSRARGIHGAGTAGDYRALLAEDPRPVISHEVGQWAVYPHLAEAAKYTGVLRAANFGLVRASLQAHGLLPLADRFFAATGRAAVHLYKAEIETILRTPNSAGFQLLSLQDYPGQGMALVGILDPFLDSKGFVTPAAWRRFCNSTVPLLRIPKRVYPADEPFVAQVDVANYGPAGLAAVPARWRITDGQGGVVAAGMLPAKTMPTGALTRLGGIAASLAKAPAPARLTVTVTLPGTPFANSWGIWVYPARVNITPPADVVVAFAWNQAARAALAAGKKVLLFAGRGYEGWRRGSFKPVFWSPVWFHRPPGTMGILCDPRHPALADFPTEFYTDWQWQDLLDHSGALVMNAAPAGFQPIVRVIDNFSRNDRLASLFEARVGPGRLIVCLFDLRERLDQRPAARQLLHSLYAYMDSAAFLPKGALTPSELDELFQPAGPGTGGSSPGS